jgi:hypothetical protein
MAQLRGRFTGSEVKEIFDIGKQGFCIDEFFMIKTGVNSRSKNKVF